MRWMTPCSCTSSMTTSPSQPHHLLCCVWQEHTVVDEVYDTLQFKHDGHVAALLGGLHVVGGCGGAACHGVLDESLYRPVPRSSCAAPRACSMYVLAVRLKATCASTNMGGWRPPLVPLLRSGKCLEASMLVQRSSSQLAS
jgi:hypothetical protein